MSACNTYMHTYTLPCDLDMLLHLALHTLKPGCQNARDMYVRTNELIVSNVMIAVCVLSCELERLLVYIHITA